MNFEKEIIRSLKRQEAALQQLRMDFHLLMRSFAELMSADEEGEPDDFCDLPEIPAEVNISINNT